jgi:hypothetical protein
MRNAKRHNTGVFTAMFVLSAALQVNVQPLNAAITFDDNIIINADLKVDGRMGHSTTSNNATSRGLYLWQTSDTNHVIYSAATSGGTSPGGSATASGLWDAGHRMRFRTFTGQGFLFENKPQPSHKG